eukprot:gene3323-2305_t
MLIGCYSLYCDIAFLRPGCVCFDYVQQRIVVLLISSKFNDLGRYFGMAGVLGEVSLSVHTCAKVCCCIPSMRLCWLYIAALLQLSPGFVWAGVGIDMTCTFIKYIILGLVLRFDFLMCRGAGSRAYYDEWRVYLLLKFVVFIKFVCGLLLQRLVWAFETDAVNGFLVCVCCAVVVSYCGGFKMWVMRYLSDSLDLCSSLIATRLFNYYDWVDVRLTCIYFSYCGTSVDLLLIVLILQQGCFVVALRFVLAEFKCLDFFVIAGCGFGDLWVIGCLLNEYYCIKLASTGPWVSFGFVCVVVGKFLWVEVVWQVYGMPRLWVLLLVCVFTVCLYIYLSLFFIVVCFPFYSFKVEGLLFGWVFDGFVVWYTVTLICCVVSCFSSYSSCDIAKYYSMSVFSLCDVGHDVQVDDFKMRGSGLTGLGTIFEVLGCACCDLFWGLFVDFKLLKLEIGLVLSLDLQGVVMNCYYLSMCLMFAGFDCGALLLVGQALYMLW